MRALLFILLIGIFTNVSAQHTFRNKQFVFSMKEPPGWIKSYVGAPNYRNEPSYSERIISFNRFTPNHQQSPNPSIDVIVDHFGSNDKRFMKRYLKVSKWGWPGGHVVFEMLKKPAQVLVNGKIAITCTMQGKLSGHGISNPYFIRKTIYYIHIDKHLFKITFTDAGKDETYASLFETIKNSVKIDQI